MVAATFRLRKWLIYSKLFRRLKPAATNFWVFAVESMLIVYDKKRRIKDGKSNMASRCYR